MKGLIIFLPINSSRMTQSPQLNLNRQTNVCYHECQRTRLTLGVTETPCLISNFILQIKYVFECFVSHKSMRPQMFHTDFNRAPDCNLFFLPLQQKFSAISVAHEKHQTENRMKPLHVRAAVSARQFRTDLLLANLDRASL